MFGSLRTFRVNDFINPSTQDNVPPLPRYVPPEKQIGATPTSDGKGQEGQAFAARSACARVVTAP
jgi:hypothetical protein